jgi:hypothetical protein
MTEGVFTEIGFKSASATGLDLGLASSPWGSWRGENGHHPEPDRLQPGCPWAASAYSTFNFYSYEAGAIASTSTRRVSPYARSSSALRLSTAPVKMGLFRINHG